MLCRRAGAWRLDCSAECDQRLVDLFTLTHLLGAFDFIDAYVGGSNRLG